MPGLDDYSALIQSGQNLVPDVLGQLTKQNALRAQTASLQAEAAANQQKVTQAQQFQQDIHYFDGSPTSASRLMLKYPEFADHIKQAYGVQDESKKQSDLLTMGEIYSAANGGNWKLAKELAHKRADAEKAAGHDDPTYDATLNVLDAAADGDQTQQNVVKNMLGMSIAAITGPDKFTETYGALTKDKGYTLGQGETRFGEDNKPVASVAAKPDFLVVPEGGKAIPLNASASAVGTGGGGPASSAAGVPTGVSPAAASVASTLTAAGLPAPVVAGFMGNFHAEGGYDGAQGDGGSASGIAQWHSDRAANFQRVIGKPVTEATPAEQAQFVAWEMKNPEAAGMTVAQRDAILAAKTPAQAAALIDQHYERSSGKDRQVRMTAANAFAGTTGGVSSAASPTAGGAPPGTQPGDVPGTVYGNPKPVAHILTSAEVKASGLDPSKVYQGHPDGTISGVGDAVADDAVDGNPNLTGAAYFNTLPKDKQGIVKTIIDGRFPISAKMTSPNVIKLFEDAARVDPTIDASTYQRRVATQRDFASGGKSGQAITSARTIINHLYNLAQESEKIGGVNWKFGNHLVNVVKGQSSDPELQGYMATLTPLSNELPKFLAGKAPTIHEIQQTREDFTPDKGPDARRKQIGTTMELMQGRFQPLVESYSQGMNRNADITDLISSVTGDRAAAAKLRALQNYAAGGRLDDVGSARASPPSPKADRQPPAGATKTATGPNGQKAALVNGHWVVY